MSEVTTTGSALPAFLQAHVDANSAAGKPSGDVASLATVQNTTPRLSLRGKFFRFMEGQEEVFKSRDPVDVFIVGVEPGPGLFTKTFYAKPYSGSDSSGEPPDCASADGVRPDPWINQPVNGDCKTCPKNQFGSATSRKGRPSKACHDSKRLYIARADAAVTEQPLEQRTLYLSQVPVSSLKELGDYGRKIQEMGIEPWMAKTKMSLDEDSEFPELSFAVNGFIEEAQVPLMKERAAKREWATSRNLMLQNQPQRMALPAHLQNALGGGAAAAPTNGLGTPAVDPVAAGAAEKVMAERPAGDGSVPGNADVLGKW